MSNHVKRFYAAVSVLAGHGNIKQRLISAFEDHLANIEDEEVPIPLKQGFTELRKTMSGVEPLNGEGHVRATVRKMSIPEADHCAKLMLDLYTDVLRYSDEAQETLPLKIGDQPLVPPFLVKSG